MLQKCKFKVYRFHFCTPLHIGDARPDDYGNSERFIRSDTLHAAVMATWATIGEEIPEESGVGFHISSLFPFFKDKQEKIHYFFPKLMSSFNLGEGAVDYAKKLKKLKWLDQKYFERQLQGAFIDFGGDGQPDIQGEFASASKVKPFMEPNITQRVTIPRVRTEKQDPVPFYMERLYFKGDAGLFCLFRGDDEQKQKFERALTVLQYEGLGTDRAVGNGAFHFEEDSIAIDVPKSATYRTNLSLFCPQNRDQLEKMLDETASFDFLSRGGWLTTARAETYRKKSIYMFKEGSVFHFDQDVAGRSSVNLTPTGVNLEHKVYRNGSSIFLPVKL